MPRVKKVQAPEVATDVTPDVGVFSTSAMALVEEKVKANPRGAPETIREPEKPSAEPCALEGAPIGSKLVIGIAEDGTKTARITTPSEVIVLPLDDIGYTLPKGAKIRRKMESVFEATQLSPQDTTSPLITSSARDAIARFRTHFATG